MTSTRIQIAVLSAVLLIAGLPPAAADPVVGVPGEPHVRIADRQLRELFENGLRGSEELRALVSRLNNSDVVAYLQPDIFASSGVAGRLTLLSVVGDIRYVLIRVTRLSSHVQQLAMVAHELQHAVEIAERPEIVDQDSMLDAYLRLGYVSGMSASGLVFDTPAANEVQARVTQELRSAFSRSDTQVDVEPADASAE